MATSFENLEKTIKKYSRKNTRKVANLPILPYILGLLIGPCLTKAKDVIVFRVIIEYSSLRDFYRPLGNNNNNTNNRSIYFYRRIFER
jgi:hypothetical protein